MDIEPAIYVLVTCLTYEDGIGGRGGWGSCINMYWIEFKSCIEQIMNLHCLGCDCILGVARDEIREESVVRNDMH